MYLATSTRPDITFHVSCLSSQLRCPSKSAWQGVKYLLSYLNTTRDRGIKYMASQSINQIEVYCDADYANDKTSRRSRTGYVTLLNNGAVSWRSHLQQRVSLSSTEAEYYAASEGCMEAAWFRQFLSEIGRPQSRVNLFEDNQSTICLANNPVADFKTKHIEIRHHYMRECVAYGELVMVKIHTNEQIADLLTKNLPSVSFHHLSNKFMTTNVVKPR